MRFDRIRIHGFGPFADVELDLTALSGTLIQIAGDNGAGKTSLLELLPGTLYRQCPTRGKLAALSTARDSYVEVDVCNGQPYTVRQIVDAHTGKGESLITRGGVPVIESGKVSEASRWVAEHFPAPDLLYSSSVSVQGRRGLLDMSATERKGVLLRALRVEHLEQRAEQARDRARAAKAQVDALRARAAELPWPELNTLAEALDEAHKRVESAAEGTRVARVALERAKAAQADAARAAELAEQRRAAEGRLSAARAQLADVDRKVANNRGLLDRADEVRAAQAETARLNAAAVTAADDEARAVQLAAGARADARAAAQLARDAVESRERAARAVESCKARCVGADDVRAAQGRADKLCREAESLDAAVAKSEARAGDLERLVLGGKDQRIAGLREPLRCIAESEDTPFASAWAQSGLRADDELAAEADKAPAELAQAREALRQARAQLSTVRNEQAKAERLAARLPDIEAAERDLKTARQALTEREQATLAAQAEADQAKLAVEQADAAVTPLRSQRAALAAQLEALAPLLALAAPLDRAETRLEELTAQCPPLQSAIEAAEHELASLPVVNVAHVDLGAQERAIAEAERAEQQARAVATRAEQALERGKEQTQKRRAIEAQVAAAEAELSDWTRLSADLGKDGLQALEIDAAVPEINEIANDLLHTCHGSRFTVEVRAERLSSDGRRSLEGLEIRVIDTEKGRDALVETYSGGECVIVGEALSLALTTIACRAAGIERPTLLRDETGAALDEENGRAYSAMLRRAARHIGADKVLVVCHGTWLMPDAVVRVGDGRLEVQA